MSPKDATEEILGEKQPVFLDFSIQVRYGPFPD
jgi:hypothetical protein